MSLAVPFGACVPHLENVIACARSPLKGRMGASKNSSRRLIITFPYWRVWSFALEMATNRTSQPHFSEDRNYQICLFDVLVCIASPSHPYPDFCCLQRLSPTSLCKFIMPSTHHKDRSSLPVCKACTAYVVSI